MLRVSRTLPRLQTAVDLALEEEALQALQREAVAAGRE